MNKYDQNGEEEGRLNSYDGIKEVISRYDRPPKGYNVHERSGSNMRQSEEERMMLERKAQIMKDQRHEQQTQQSKAPNRVRFDEQQLTQESNGQQNYQGDNQRISELQEAINKERQAYEIARQEREIYEQELERKRQTIEQQQEQMYKGSSRNGQQSESMQAQNIQQQQQQQKQQYQQQLQQQQYQQQKQQQQQQYQQQQQQQQQQNTLDLPEQNRDRMNNMDMVQLRDAPYEQPQRLSTGFTHPAYQNVNPPHQFDHGREGQQNFHQKPNQYDTHYQGGSQQNGNQLPTDHPDYDFKVILYTS